MSNTTQSNVNEVLTDMTDVADVAAAATGNPVAGVVAAGLGAAGAVTASVEEGVAAHQAALTTAIGAANSLASASAPVIAALPAADQQKATGILAAISDLLSDLGKIF
jgi:hypothetical protein